MLNQAVLIGRLVRSPELKETEGGRKVSRITLAVPRSYKNMKGEYETDFIDCVLWQGIAESTIEYSKKGDLLGIKGHIQSKSVQINENEKKHITEIVAEKVTFLSPKTKVSEE